MTAEPQDQQRIEALARELCLAEGWDPDEQIACEPGEVAAARLDAEAGQWLCRRWQAYADAAAGKLKQADDWEVF